MKKEKEKEKSNILSKEVAKERAENIAKMTDNRLNMGTLTQVTIDGITINVWE